MTKNATVTDMLMMKSIIIMIVSMVSVILFVMLSPCVGRFKAISPVWEGRGYNTDNTKETNAIKNSKAAFLLHVVTLC